MKIATKNDRSDSLTVDYSSINASINKEKVDQDLTKFFDLEISNKKYDKAKKFLKNASSRLMSRHELLNQNYRINFFGFKIEWMKNKKDVDGNNHKEEEEH